MLKFTFEELFDIMVDIAELVKDGWKFDLCDNIYCYGFAKHEAHGTHFFSDEKDLKNWLEKFIGQ